MWVDCHDPTIFFVYENTFWTIYGQWYSKLKRKCCYDQEKYEQIICEEIEKIKDKEQAYKLAEHYSKVRKGFNALNDSDIQVPHFEENTIP